MVLPLLTQSADTQSMPKTSTPTTRGRQEYAIFSGKWFVVSAQHSQDTTVQLQTAIRHLGGKIGRRLTPETAFYLVPGSSLSNYDETVLVNMKKSMKGMSYDSPIVVNSTWIQQVFSAAAWSCPDQAGFLVGPHQPAQYSNHVSRALAELGQQSSHANSPSSFDHIFTESQDDTLAMELQDSSNVKKTLDDGNFENHQPQIKLRRPAEMDANHPDHPSSFAQHKVYTSQKPRVTTQ